MPRVLRKRGRTLPALAAAFCVGAVAGWWLRGHGPPEPAMSADSIEIAAPAPAAVSTLGRSPARPAAPTPKRSAAADAAAIDALRGAMLRVPIDGVNPEKWKGEFAQARDGTRTHEAVDILAPRNTPIHAVDDGTIAKLFESKAGGHTIYQADPTGRFAYYYAHLERYANGLSDGQHVSRGEVIGYVGTSGNAPPGTPHLHFTIFELADPHRWWDGRAIDPYLVYKH